LLLNLQQSGAFTYAADRKNDLSPEFLKLHILEVM